MQRFFPFRFVQSYLAQSARLYVGPMRVDTFPNARSFVAAAVLVMVAMYALDLFVGGADVQTIRNDLPITGVALAIPLLFQRMLRWTSAFLGVSIVSMLGIIPLDGVAALIRSQQSPLGTLPTTISYAAQAWYAVTVARMIFAWLREERSSQRAR